MQACRGDGESLAHRRTCLNKCDHSTSVGRIACRFARVRRAFGPIGRPGVAGSVFLPSLITLSRPLARSFRPAFSPSIRETGSRVPLLNNGNFIPKIGGQWRVNSRGGNRHPRTLRDCEPQPAVCGFIQAGRLREASAAGPNRLMFILKCYAPRVWQHLSILTKRTFPTADSGFLPLRSAPCLFPPDCQYILFSFRYTVFFYLQSSSFALASLYRDRGLLATDDYRVVGSSLSGRLIPFR